MRARKPSDDNDEECGGKSVKRERKEKHLNLKMMTRMMKEEKQVKDSPLLTSRFKSSQEGKKTVDYKNTSSPEHFLMPFIRHFIPPIHAHHSTLRADYEHKQKMRISDDELPRLNSQPTWRKKWEVSQSQNGIRGI